MPRLGANTVYLIEAANAVLSRYDHPITLRQCYYRLVSDGTIENSKQSYDRLGKALTKGRKAGLLDPTALTDLTREPDLPQVYSSLDTYMQLVLRWYERNYWQAQDEYVEIWVEKEALKTVFLPVCDQWQVPLQVCRGYSSVSMLVDAAQRFKHRLDAGKRIHIVYFGDHDPSGKDIPKAARKGIALWGLCVSDPDHDYYDEWMSFVDGDVMTLKALTQAQIEHYQLPPVPPKASDARHDSFVAEYGTDSVELDALEPSVLRGMIEESIRGFIDWDAWEAQEALEKQDKAKLKEFVAAARKK